MRKIILVLALLSGLWGQPIQNDDAFKYAVASMGEDEKLVLMIYTADDCPECAYMKKKVFLDPEVKPYLNTHFSIIEKNVHRDKLPDGYDYFGIPTMFFITKSGVKRETLIGSKRAGEFNKELHRIRGIK